MFHDVEVAWQALEVVESAGEVKSDELRDALRVKRQGQGPGR
jgi:hypothetical protein